MLLECLVTFPLYGIFSFIICTERIFRKDIVLSCVCDFVLLLFLFIYLFFFVRYHDNSWKPQPIRTKFSHMTFDWNSSANFENGHCRSHVTPLIGGFCPPPQKKLTYLRFRPIQTKFSHMTFDWNISSEFENWNHRSNVAPPNGVSAPPPPQGKFKYLQFWWNWSHMY